MISIENFYEDLNNMNLDEFLSWYKQRTEAAWLQYKTLSLEDFQRSGVGGSSWQAGTKWIGGFSTHEIEVIEQEWGISFPPDYRLFLTHLGAPDRHKFGVGWRSDNEMVQANRPSFYHWQEDVEYIKDALSWPLEGLLFDVENGLWWESWGPRPDTPEERRKTVSSLVEKAPPLIPIIGHRYLLSYPLRSGNPVLSIYQSDIIVYGTDLKQFLALELAGLLNINHNRAYQNATKNYNEDSIASIPFWGDIMLNPPLEFKNIDAMRK